MTFSRFSFIALIGSITLLGLTAAAFPPWALSLAQGVVERVDRAGSAYPIHFDRGFYVGPRVPDPTSTTANKVTRMLSASATIDVATATAACNDSAAVTVVGAQVGDPCFVGAPTTITGAGTGLSSSFTCYVSAADAVKLRHCPVGTAVDDPASATWFFRVISQQ